MSDQDDSTLAGLRQYLLPDPAVQEDMDLEIPSWLVRDAVEELSSLQEELAEYDNDWTRARRVYALAKRQLARGPYKHPKLRDAYMRASNRAKWLRAALDLAEGGTTDIEILERMARRED